MRCMSAMAHLKIATIQNTGFRSMPTGIRRRHFRSPGRGLVVGVDRNGEDCDARISLEELTARVSFTRRKFRGFKAKTGGAFDLEIELQAPIVEEH